MVTGFLVAVIIFVWGVGSLLLVAFKTDSFKSVFLKTPSIIVGDVFILPLIGALIGSAWHDSNPNFLSGHVTYILLFLALLLAALSAIRNQLLNPWWLPHIFFYWFLAFVVLLFLATAFDARSMLWWLVLVGILIHQLLGIVYPKKFPKIKNNF